jgi:hypothetical protein
MTPDLPNQFQMGFVRKQHRVRNQAAEFGGIYGLAIAPVETRVYIGCEGNSKRIVGVHTDHACLFAYKLRQLVRIADSDVIGRKIAQ